MTITYIEQRHFGSLTGRSGLTTMERQRVSVFSAVGRSQKIVEALEDGRLLKTSLGAVPCVLRSRSDDRDGWGKGRQQSL